MILAQVSRVVGIFLSFLMIFNSYTVMFDVFEYRLEVCSILL